MTLRSRQRRRTTQQRQPSPPPQKWPETMEELYALPDFAMNKKPIKTPAAPNNLAVARTWPEENSLPSPQAEAPWHQLPLAPITKPVISNLPLRITPWYSPPKPTPFQFTTANTGRTSIVTPYKDPDPQPGPPPHPEPKTANTTPRYAFSDPGIAAAQQAQAQREKELQDQLMTAPFLSTFNPNAPRPGQTPVNGGQPTKPSGGSPGAHPSSIYGWTEWDVPGGALNESNESSDVFEYNWKGEHVTDQFKKKVIDICSKLEMNPDDLMAIMAFESGGIQPDIQNKTSGATGLIQFMPGTAKSLGTTTDELAQMTAVEQLDYVYKYFKPYAGKIHNIGDAYMVVLMPPAVGKADDFPIGIKDSKDYLSGKLTYGAVYKANSGLDTNKDGIITKAEAVQFVIRKRDKYK